MTVADFLQHWSLTQNPFRGEEARADDVFARMGPAGPRTAIAESPGAPAVYHSDFDKILGDLKRPSSSVVFGEKGSGKTAIRLQLAQRIHEFNVAGRGGRVLLVAYDDLNGVLDRLHERVGGKSPLDSLQQIRLVDHIDGVLSQVTPRLIDAVLGQKDSERVGAEKAGPEAISLGEHPRKLVRGLDPVAKRDLLLLQALYDKADAADLRTGKLRKRLGIGLPMTAWLARAVIWIVPVLLAAAFVFHYFFAEGVLANEWVMYVILGLAAVWVLAALKLLLWDRFVLLRLARSIRKQIRVTARGLESYARSLRQLDPVLREPGVLPVTDSDEARYVLLDRFKRVLRPLGYSGVILIVDRVDEPTLVSGDPERMKALTWPMLNNKFLQQDGLGVKLLLPVELRHALFRESSAFFQEARLDKQSLVERLTWTGAMLFDLCEARLRACRPASTEPIDLMAIFDEDVSRQDVIDALDRMHQPRDAFKLMYRVLTEHCSSVTAGENAWRIPRHVLQTVQKQESDRVQQLYRGIRPG